jgi:hypothetical protein
MITGVSPAPSNDMLLYTFYFANFHHTSLNKVVIKSRTSNTMISKSDMDPESFRFKIYGTVANISNIVSKSGVRPRNST